MFIRILGKKNKRCPCPCSCPLDYKCTACTEEQPDHAKSTPFYRIEKSDLSCGPCLNENTDNQTQKVEEVPCRDTKRSTWFKNRKTLKELKRVTKEDEKRLEYLRREHERQEREAEFLVQLIQREIAIREAALQLEKIPELDLSKILCKQFPCFNASCSACNSNEDNRKYSKEDNKKCCKDDNIKYCKEDNIKYCKEDSIKYRKEDNRKCCKEDNVKHTKEDNTKCSKEDNKKYIKEDNREYCKEANIKYRKEDNSKYSKEDNSSKQDYRKYSKEDNSSNEDNRKYSKKDKIKYSKEDNRKYSKKDRIRFSKEDNRKCSKEGNIKQNPKKKKQKTSRGFGIAKPLFGPCIYNNYESTRGYHQKDSFNERFSNFCYRICCQFYCCVTIILVLGILFLWWC